MAEAAGSAAPAQSAPATGSPSPGSASAEPSTSTPVTESAASPTEQVLAKPAKPIPSLPGVFPDEDPFPAPSAPAVKRAKGPDGRFVASPSSATNDAPVGEHSLETESQPGSEPFEFAGEKYASRAEAEQNVKSLRGQYKPILALAKQVGGLEKIPATVTAAAESARAWKAEADRLRAELSGRQPATPAAPTKDAPAPPAAEAQADVDWELYAEVKKLATERNEPWKAEQWLITQVRKLDQERTQRLLDERDAPIKAQRAQDAIAAQTETLFSSLADYTHEDGSPAFPELADEAAAFEIGRMWSQLGLPPQSALTPQGAIAAIALYRMARPKESQARVAPTPPPPPAPPQPTDAHGAADLGDGQQRAMSVGGDGTPSAEAQRIKAALRSANSPNRALLGFDA